MKPKTYVHERPETATCQFGWAEQDTMAPHEVRHECELRDHLEDNQHVCTCGLIEVETATAPASRTDSVWDDFAEWLQSQGYGWPLPMPDEWYIALIPRPFNVRLVLGDVEDRTGLLDGWCYTGPQEALAGLLDWWQHPDQPEPTGWFRHPGTGRRVARTHGEIDNDGQAHAVGETYIRA